MSAPSDWARRYANAAFGLAPRDLTAVLDAVRAEVLEEAAREADHLSDGPGVGVASEIAARIRALATREGGAT